MTNEKQYPKIAKKLFDDNVLDRVQNKDEKNILLSNFELGKNDQLSYEFKYQKDSDCKKKLAYILASIGYTKDPYENFNDFLSEIRERNLLHAQNNTPSDFKQNVESIFNKLEQDLRKEKINKTRQDNKAREELFNQTKELRKLIFEFLIILMSLETFLLYIIVIASSIPKLKELGFFYINETTLQILVGATIAQISAMVIIIVKSVFPDSSKKILGEDYKSE